MADIPVYEGLGETLVTITTNGQSVVAFDFLAFSADQVKAEYRPLSGAAFPLVLNTNYTVSGLSQPNGGSLSLSGFTRSVGDQIYIYRETPIEREKDWQNEGDYKADLVNREQDEIFMIMQELDRGIKKDGGEIDDLRVALSQETTERISEDNRIETESKQRDDAIASIIGGSGTSQVYDTKLALEFAKVDPSVGSVFITGYTEPGIAGFILKKVLSEPAYGGIKSFDGAWWEPCSGTSVMSREELISVSSDGMRLPDGYVIEVGELRYISSNRPVGTQLIPGFDNLNSIKDGKRFSLAINNMILDPKGNRFIIKGAQMFDYLLISFEARDDQKYRKILQPAGKGPGTGISEPTYYASVSYKDRENVEEQIKLAVANGVNLIRVGVEPAMVLASVPYVDPTDGKTYPSDIEMLDTIVDVAANYGVVVQLQQGDDRASTTDIQNFLRWLVRRYHFMPHVWLNPANEPLGYATGMGDVHSPTDWLARMSPLVASVQEDIPGYPVGTKWINPVCIDPPSWASRLDLVAGYLTAAPFVGLQTLVVNIHVYPRSGEYDFRHFQLDEARVWWLNAATSGAFCVAIGETGIDNFGGRYDPDLDPGIPSVDPSGITWARMQAFMQDFLNFIISEIPYSPLNGLIGHMWFAYVPGLSMHDDNTMRRIDGTWTTWGLIFRQYFMAPAYSTQPLLRKAGGLEYIPMSIPGVLGEALWQVEGKTGSRPAQTSIMQAATDPYHAFVNRSGGGGTGALVGTLAGTSGGGLALNSLSDARAKGNVREPTEEEILNAFSNLYGRKGHYLNAPDEDIFLFIAQELEIAVPNSVTKPKSENEMMLADYTATVPLIAAMVRLIAKKMNLI